MPTSIEAFSLAQLHSFEAVPSIYTLVYSIIVVICIVIGSALKVGLVWSLSDFFNGLMALPNLTAILLLSPEALDLWRAWVGKKRGKQALSCIPGGKSLY